MDKRSSFDALDEHTFIHSCVSCHDIDEQLAAVPSFFFATAFKTASLHESELNALMNREDDCE
ncbi:hypothetical protein PAMP_018973 [Pampus punctatissimus]